VNTNGIAVGNFLEICIWPVIWARQAFSDFLLVWWKLFSIFMIIKNTQISVQCLCTFVSSSLSLWICKNFDKTCDSQVMSSGSCSTSIFIWSFAAPRQLRSPSLSYVFLIYSFSYIGWSESGWPGADVMIFKYFRRKILQKIGVFDSKQS
jgi:hypothetical protein